MHETSDDLFYSIITFSYTKYFVHSLTVDVVFTLSYQYQLKLGYTVSICWDYTISFCVTTLKLREYLHDA